MPEKEYTKIPFPWTAPNANMLDQYSLEELVAQVEKYEQSISEQQGKPISLDHIIPQEYMQQMPDKASTENWQIPAPVKITSLGRAYVGKDPNITEYTIKKLLASEMKLLTDKMLQHIFSQSPEQLAETEFYESNELGLAHVALCIKENLNQTKADLIASFSMDRNIPFVLGAIYINALHKYHGLYYYQFSPDTGYQKMPWEPQDVSVYKKPKMPIEKTEMKKSSKVPETLPGDIPRCPECNSKASIMRTGRRGSQYCVCCSNEECKWYYGTAPRTKESEARNDWLKICSIASGQSPSANQS